MKICAHVLVKNEARFIWYSVSSIVDHVDKVLLWDTGSTDKSIEIEKELVQKYPGKIIFKKITVENFDEESIRQQMLDETKSDWFIVLDADEIWWEESIKKVVDLIKKRGDEFESIIVPTILPVGDIFHYQEKAAGRYKFGDRVGHYNLRAVKRSIPGLCSQGPHGVWGWADGTGKMIQDRNSYKFVNAPYLHATNLKRSSADEDVIKRIKKYRFELGESFPRDFYYPEVLFKDKPSIVPNPWEAASGSFKFRAFFETPLRKIKRRVFNSKVGY